MAGDPRLSGDEVVPLSALIPDFEAQLERVMVAAAERHRQLEATVELATEKATGHALPVIVDPAVPALLENNLSRKGVWATGPDRRVLEFRYQTEDVIGSLTVEYSLGQLSTFEMELVAWLMGRWEASSPMITFSLRECAREFQVAWSGQRASLIREALRRIDRTRFTGRVWDARTKRYTVQHFGIFDRVVLVARKEQFDDPEPQQATVTVTLSSFMHEQLAARQFVRLDWEVLRGRLHTPLGRRLYAFLESQRGWDGGCRYEVAVSAQLVQSLGSRESRPRQFRARLARAGAEVVEACDRYQRIAIRPGQERGAYVLQVERTAA